MTYWFGRVSRLRHRHYGSTIEGVAVVVVITALLVTSGTRAAWIAAAIGQSLMFVPTVMQIRHRWGPPCAECVRVMPLNPGESAREPGRSRRALRAFHAGTETLPRFFLGVAVALVLLVLGTRWFYTVLGMDGAAAWSNVFLSLGLGYTATVNWLTRTHNRLGPWCPYCDDEDGDEDEEPAVDPSGGRGRPAPV